MRLPRLPARNADRTVSGRLLEGPSALLSSSAYRLELQSAGALMPGLALADLAHILALLDQGILPPGPAREIGRASCRERV